MVGLVATLKCENEVHLVVGSSPMSAFRIRTILEAGALPIVLITNDHDISPALREYVENNKIRLLKQEFTKEVLTTVGRKETNHVVDKVFVNINDKELQQTIFTECRRLRIPINTSDNSQLSTFTLMSTYTSGDFQLGVTTNGKGCKLAARLRRELSQHVPTNIDKICSNVGELRKLIKLEDKLDDSKDSEIGENDDDAVNTSKLNSLVKEFLMTAEEKKLRRSRWLSQIVEYYPLEKLATLNMEELSHEYSIRSPTPEPQAEPAQVETEEDKRPKGSISLIGAGPGSVSLLTIGALHAIQNADLVLADKLVPQAVLDLIPKHRTQLFIAKKFPGNAERAQEELLALGLEAVLRGDNVVRLKQGDPYIFGRGGEEFLFFELHGFTPRVIPGISSALAAPVLSHVPMTQRDVADQVLVCTGTGRKGALPDLPAFNPKRTTVFLMALHRIVELIPKMIDEAGWAPQLPCCIVERALCPDQRVIRTSLAKVADAVQACGSRPPGLLITGNACGVLREHSGSEWTIEEGYFDTLGSLANNVHF
ncbi:uncharacterized protein KQ657_002631 [Scheffersomyces spartinae]|uniref:Precorrin-2 dehydrogenase n=1 Tax=Scheffersomyces spartinae TaxID=45513 RepID=A0A9P7V600_9ASCO|nr:uncharacterized protein KQ657_002631 [Scheffersomyces spartinae]KAG7192023.1 hypothetical protein KQ657_002631 [Scheffersomyces spartinae]